jgi:hypothetical protein
MAKKYAIIGTMLLQAMMIVSSENGKELRRSSNSLSPSQPRDTLRHSHGIVKPSEGIILSSRGCYTGSCSNPKLADLRREMIPADGSIRYGEQYP